ncbi:unnamed protein product, partial [Rotaria sordida]
VPANGKSTTTTTTTTTSTTATTSSTTTGFICYPECQNNGTCIQTNTCLCATDFTGSSCEIQSGGLCSDDNTTNIAPIFLVTFGSGSATFSSATPANFSFTTTYQQAFTIPIEDGYFAFTNAIPNVNTVWHTGALDHTPNDIDGYMFLANADPNPGQFYRGTVNNLCIGERYEFSAYLTNLVGPFGLAKPSVIFQIRTSTSDNTLIGQLDTGEIPEYSTMTWTKLASMIQNCSIQHRTIK